MLIVELELCTRIVNILINILTTCVTTVYRNVWIDGQPEQYNDFFGTSRRSECADGAGLRHTESNSNCYSSEKLTKLAVFSFFLRLMPFKIHTLDFVLLPYNAAVIKILVGQSNVRSGQLVYQINCFFRLTHTVSVP